MRFRLSVIAVLCAVYLASGLFVVRGNQRAVVRRFGRLVTTADGVPRLVGSGLHYDAPWPMTQRTYVNVNEVRTLKVGLTDELPEGSDTEFLRAVHPDRLAQFLTGDKNVLNLQLTVQYRVSEQNIADFCFRSVSPEKQLAGIVEAVAADLVLCSGVDYVHPLGLAELRALLTRRTQALAEKQRLGIVIEDAGITAVSPPIQVKAEFLDVSNARADRVTYLNAARSYSDEHLSYATAEAQAVRNEALIYRQRTVETARSQAESFNRLLAQLKADDSEGSADLGRAMLMGRMYLETMQSILSRAQSKVIVTGEEPVDMTIYRSGEE